MPQAACPLYERCMFFNDRMKIFDKAVIPGHKANFCSANFAGCARYMVQMTMGPQKVPHDLMPDQVQRARELMGKP